MTKTINIVTLGCSKNLVDSENLMGYLKANHFNIIHDSNLPSDIAIVNTCGFINDAKQESVDTILDFVEAKKRGDLKLLYIMGCLSQRYREDLKNEIPEADGIYGVNDMQLILQDIGVKLSNATTPQRYLTTPSHYAYLKISEGCDRNCSFCAIPMIRGKHISRPFEDIIAEAQYLAQQGVKELILIAQDTTYYGYDLYKKQRIVELMQALSAVDKIEWVRLHYVYPQNFPEELLQLMKDNDKVCSYLDIPFQHISDGMLSKMKRNTSKAYCYQIIKDIREMLPNAVIRTTMLVGHPGETEDDFNELLQFVRDVKFDRLGVFKYSHEEDTFSGNTFEDDISDEVKEERMNAIMELQMEISNDLNFKKIGNIYKVIIDRKEGEYFVGRTEYDSPEVDNEVIIKTTKKLKIGDFYSVKINNSGEYDLEGDIVF